MNTWPSDVCETLKKMKDKAETNGAPVTSLTVEDETSKYIAFLRNAYDEERRARFMAQEEVNKLKIENRNLASQLLMKHSHDLESDRLISSLKIDRVVHVVMGKGVEAIFDDQSIAQRFIEARQMESGDVLHCESFGVHAAR